MNVSWPQIEKATKHWSTIENVTHASISLDCVHSKVGNIHVVQLRVLQMTKAIRALRCAAGSWKLESPRGRRVGKYANTGGEGAKEPQRMSTEHGAHNVGDSEQEVRGTFNVAVESNPTGPARWL